MALRQTVAKPSNPQAQVTGFTGVDGTNLVTNPSFELTSVGHAMTFTSARARTGSWSVTATSNGSSGFWESFSQNTQFAAVGGQQVHIEWWVYGDPANTSTGVDASGLLTGIWCYGSSVVLTTNSFNAGAALTGTWTKCSTTVTVPNYSGSGKSGVATILPMVWLQSSAVTVGDKYYFDDPVCFMPGTQVAVGLTAGGQVSAAAAQPTIIANPFVGPQALRHVFPRQPLAQSQLAGFTQNDGSTAATVGLSAAGVLGDVSSSPDAISVGLVAGGSVGLTAGASASVVVAGLSAAGVEGDVSQAALPAIVGLTAGGVAASFGYSGGGGAVAVRAGLVAAGSLGFAGGAARAVVAVLSGAGFIIDFEGGGTQVVKAESRVQVVEPELRVRVVRPESRSVTVLKVL